MRRQEETRRILDEAREALLGFAATHGRLPCPATSASRGEESFAAGRRLPERQLRQLSTTDSCRRPRSGSRRSIRRASRAMAGATQANRVRYAVFGAGRAVGGVTNPMTRANGMQQATLAALGDAPGFLVICGVGSLGGRIGLRPGREPAHAPRRLRAPFARGQRGAGHPGPGTDESRNLDGDGVFVSREISTAPGNEFDDTLTWVPVNVLAGRMIAAGAA